MEETKKPLPVKDVQSSNIKDVDGLLMRILISQRRHAIEGPSIKNQVRSYLYALEAKDMGLKAEDIK